MRWCCCVWRITGNGRKAAGSEAGSHAKEKAEVVKLNARSEAKQFLGKLQSILGRGAYYEGAGQIYFPPLQIDCPGPAKARASSWPRDLGVCSLAAANVRRAFALRTFGFSGGLGICAKRMKGVLARCIKKGVFPGKPAMPFPRNHLTVRHWLKKRPFSAKMEKKTTGAARRPWN